MDDWLGFAAHEGVRDRLGRPRAACWGQFGRLRGSSGPDATVPAARFSVSRPGRRTSAVGSRGSSRAAALPAASGRYRHQPPPPRRGFQQSGPVREVDTLGEEAELVEEVAPGTGLCPTRPPQLAEAVQHCVQGAGQQVQRRQQIRQALLGRARSIWDGSLPFSSVGQSGGSGESQREVPPGAEITATLHTTPPLGPKA